MKAQKFHSIKLLREVLKLLVYREGLDQIVLIFDEQDVLGVLYSQKLQQPGPRVPASQSLLQVYLLEQLVDLPSDLTSAVTRGLGGLVSLLRPHDQVAPDLVVDFGDAVGKFRICQ